MAIIGFIVCFIILVYLTFSVVGSVFLCKLFGSNIDYTGILLVIISLALLAMGWYYLLKDITISIGGI
jgi:hypothetical protein